VKAMRRPPPPTSREQREIRKRIKFDVDKYIDTRRQTISDRVCGLVCLVLHDELGFGEMRIRRFMSALDDAAKEYLRDHADDVGDDLMFAHLEHIGMGDLVSRIRQDMIAEEESIKDTIFDLKTDGGGDDQ